MKTVIKILLATACCCTLSTAGVISVNFQKKAAESSRPNVILIIADDLGVDDLSCEGSPNVQTPNMDRLASEGIRFKTAFVTASSCSPSRGSIITGRYPHCTGCPELVPGNKDEYLTDFCDGVEFFPEILKKNGYYTAHSGKWHIGDSNWYNPGGRALAGFDVAEGCSQQQGGTANWIPVLQNRPKDRPFFFWFASHDPHWPFTATTGEYAIDGEKTDPAKIRLPPYMPEFQRQNYSMYLDEVKRLDLFIGGLLDVLEEEGVADNTLIIMTSDNGRPFHRCKAFLYDSGARTPFLVRWPARIKPGAESDALVSTLDIAPTVLDAAGVLDQASTFQGHSLLPVFDDPSKTVRDAVFAERNWHIYPAHQRSIRTKKFLYIRNAHPELPLGSDGPLLPAPRPAEELFDVVNDPDNLQNLASNPEYAAILEKFRSQLDAWQKETGDTVPDDLTPPWTGPEGSGDWGIRGTLPGAPDFGF